MKPIILAVLTITLLAAACTNQPTPAEPISTDEPEVVVPVTGSNPTETLPPQPTETIAPTSLPISITGVVQVATLNLRSGPSVLHEILKLYQKGETVTVLGHAPGFEWVKVITADGKIGWMYVGFMELAQSVNDTPELDISESLVAKGKVVDQNDAGVPGIQVGLTYVGGVERVRVTGTTMQDGTFYAYAPIEFQGPWVSTVIGVGCTSPIVDANCRYSGKFTPLEGINIKLPQDVELKFVYQ